MAIFTESEYNNILLPVNDKDLHKNPLVNQIFGKVSTEDIPMLRYIALLYDIKSPLRLKIPDIVERKEECAEMANIKDGKLEIFDLSNDKLLGYINVYLRYQSSKVWAVLAANEEVLWQYLQNQNTTISYYP